MTKSDWYGLGSSIALHLLLLLIFGMMSLGVTDPEPIGYVEVEFGPIAEGRPVQRAAEDRAAVTPEPPKPEPEPEREVSPPEEAKPVNLAKQPTEVVDEEKVQTPETETISPAKQNNEESVAEKEPKPKPEPVKPLGGGTKEGTTGDTQGDEGEGDDETKTAPFQIEGLNRTMVYAPLPAYSEKVNADIKVRITVDPQGRITRVFPLLKGSPQLERAVRDALERWRFNALPLNAPQENQTGTITFRFRLE